MAMSSLAILNWEELNKKCYSDFRLLVQSHYSLKATVFWVTTSCTSRDSDVAEEDIPSIFMV